MQENKELIIQNSFLEVGGVVACSWSGGKDCCFALMEAKRMGYTPKVLLNMTDEDLVTSKSHNLSVAVLQEQAKAMNLHLLYIATSDKEYEQNFINALSRLKNEFNIHTVVFGDIDLMAHREWIERVCTIAGIKPLFPLWKRKREELAQEIATSGIETVIVACNHHMGESFLGRTYTSALIEEFKNMGVDTCGEDGEFHSLVVNGPLFRYRMELPPHAPCRDEKRCFLTWETPTP